MRLNFRFKVNAKAQPGLVFHPPCTLQHGQLLRGGVESHLQELGFRVRIAARDSHLCCGSAGTYSVLNLTLSYQLRDRKLDNLQAQQDEVIISANIGCITHLQSGTPLPVKHWVSAGRCPERLNARTCLLRLRPVRNVLAQFCWDF
jgi:glycolate oxidase iron-sulfur subunit